jgi:hypothetical protein
MQRGIVVEVKARHWVIMTSDGSFIKVPNEDEKVQPGEEITIQPKASKLHHNWKVLVSGAVAALLAFFLLFPYFSGNEAQAKNYIYLEIQPSVAFGINRKDIVVELKPMNQSAQILSSHLEWKQEKVDQVVVEYLKQAKSKGMIKKSDPVVISAVDQDQTKVTLKSIRSRIEEDKELTSPKWGLKVFTLPVPRFMQAEVDKSGLTPGKYGVWLLAQHESNTQIPAEEVAQKSIREITGDQPVSKFLNSPPTEKQWKELVKERQEKEESEQKQKPADPSKEDNKNKKDHPAKEKPTKDQQDEKQKEPTPNQSDENNSSQRGQNDVPSSSDNVKQDDKSQKNTGDSSQNEQWNSQSNQSP